MSSEGKRTRELDISIGVPNAHAEDGTISKGTGYTFSAGRGVQFTESESHRRNPKTGKYDAGGPFYTSRSQPFIRTGYVSNVRVGSSGGKDVLYTGPILCDNIAGADITKLGYLGKFGDKEESSLNKLGTTAISLCNPVNPASDLGTGLAETMREGVPSIPGIQTWEKRANLAKAAGSEYLNYIFGWAPLVKEVHDVSKAARNHRDIMNQYHHGEGRVTHRRFDFPLQHTRKEYDVAAAWPLAMGVNSVSIDTESTAPKRQVSIEKETRTWFEGAFTYGLPSRSDSWKKAIGFGSNADELFGIALTPDILWELTPWSWAVDWFSNAGEVINNVTNFGLAGLVMRYGYMMMESIERVEVATSSANFIQRINPNKSPAKYKSIGSGSSARGYEVVTKRRVPANPFGFGIGWEGLSPTQLAITAALGITRVL